MKNENEVVANLADVTDLSDGVPISKVSPNETPQNVVPLAGLVVNVIVFPLTV